jgi:hypothetical protein
MHRSSIERKYSRILTRYTHGLRASMQTLVEFLPMIRYSTVTHRGTHRVLIGYSQGYSQEYSKGAHMQTLAYLLPMIRHILAQPPLQVGPDGPTSAPGPTGCAHICAGTD